MKGDNWWNKKGSLGLNLCGSLTIDLSTLLQLGCQQGIHWEKGITIKLGHDNLFFDSLSMEGIEVILVKSALKQKAIIL